MSPRRPIAVLSLLVLVAAQSARDKRPVYAPAAYMIEIDGVGTATVGQVDGGYLLGEVVSNQTGNSLAPQKHVASIRVVPLTIEVAPGELSSWITQSMAGNAQPVSGRIVEMDADHTIVGERQFHDALLTEIAFPAIDGSSKEAARVKLTFQPQRIITRKGDGSKASVAGQKDMKRATTSNFRVTIPGADSSGVSRVEPITVKCKLTEATAGEVKSAKPQVASVTAGDLVLSTTDAKSVALAQWAEDTLVKGGQDKEKTVTVELLSPDMKSTLLTLEGSGVGIYALRPVSGGADQTRRTEALMYVERWQLK